MLIILLWGEISRAELSIQLVPGFLVGALGGEETGVSKGHSLGMAVQWNFPWGVFVGGRREHVEFGVSQGVKKSGVMTLSGASLGWGIPMGNIRLEASGTYFGNSAMVLKSKNSFLVNEDVYQYSIQETLRGEAPMGADLNFLWRKQNKRLSGDQLITIGLFGSVRVQSYNSVDFSVISSHQSVLPEKTESLRETYDFNWFVLGVSGGFTL